jgi:putative addiction module component (TIGR02574 family)
MRVKDIPGIAELSMPEKILLVEDLWESISSRGDIVPLPGSHKKELERRYDNYKSAPGNLLSLEELQEKIEVRKSS